MFSRYISSGPSISYLSLSGPSSFGTIFWSRIFLVVHYQRAFKLSDLYLSIGKILYSIESCVKWGVFL